MDGVEENGCVDSTQQPIINLKQRFPHPNSIKPFPIYFQHAHISKNTVYCIFWCWFISSLSFVVCTVLMNPKSVVLYLSQLPVTPMPVSRSLVRKGKKFLVKLASFVVGTVWLLLRSPHGKTQWHWMSCGTINTLNRHVNYILNKEGKINMNYRQLTSRELCT